MPMRVNVRHEPGERCCIPFCDGVATVLHMCNACYQAELKWAARKPWERAKRLRQVQKFEARMERLKPVGRHLRSVPR